MEGGLSGGSQALLFLFLVLQLAGTIHETLNFKKITEFHGRRSVNLGQVVVKLIFQSRFLEGKTKQLDTQRLLEVEVLTSCSGCIGQFPTQAAYLFLLPTS